MPDKQGAARPSVPDGQHDPQALAFAWRAHEAVQGWIESVDIKTSIVLVAEVALAGAAAGSLLANGGELHQARGLHLACGIVAVLALTTSVGAALWVVFPRLGSRKIRAGASNDVIYFGHLRRFSGDDIEDILKTMTPESELRQLSRQLAVTGTVAWRKHVWLQWSIVLFAVGASFFVLSLVAFGSPDTSQPPPLKVRIIE